MKQLDLPPIADRRLAVARSFDFGKLIGREMPDTRT